jgi:hypothetical protein
MAFMLVLACELKDEEKLTAMQDLKLNKASGKFKYKHDEAEDANQGWKIAGECPTAYQNFNQVPLFRIRVRQVGEIDSLDHPFYNSTGVIGRDGNRYKQRFFYYPVTRSKNHRLPSYGFFKASIKDGNLKFMYAVTKANEGGMMVNMQYFDDVKDTTSESNKFKAAANIGVTVELGSEVHDSDNMVKYTAKEKMTKAKIIKQ